MAKEICISSTPHETRLAILEDDQLTEIYYERENEYTLAGSIYKGRVTRVLPGMQSAFVDLGLERDAFLYVTDFMEEQEDSADFEKVPSGNGHGGNGHRGPSAPEAQSPREPRESRPSRTAASVEPEARTAGAADGRRPVVAPGDAEPGEDDQQGTRRWRGRRGRRRGGRPQGPRESGPGIGRPAAAPGSVSEDGGAEVGEFEIVVESGPTIYEESVAHGGGQAAFSETVAPRVSAPVREESPAPRMANAGSDTPIVLPGESLSRYGGKPAGSASRQEAKGSETKAPAGAAGSAYKPSTMVEVVPGWDGGAELPGETLSRYRGKPQGAAPLAAAPTSAPSEIVTHAWEAPAADHGEANDGEAGELQTEEPFAASAAGHSAAPMSQPHEWEAEHGNGHAEAAAPEHRAQEGEEKASGEAAAGPMSHHEVVEPPVQTPEALHGLTAEPAQREELVQDKQSIRDEERHFEPESASASYRLDPAGPSEYRVTSLLEQEPAIEAEPPTPEPTRPVEQAVAATEEPASVPAPATVHDNSAAAQDEDEPRAEPVAPPEELSSAVYEDEVSPPAHLDTSVEAADPLLDLSSRGAAQAEELPMRSDAESVIEALNEFLGESEDSDPAYDARGFAPGSGTLEEEIIEEEEYDSEPIQAYADDGDLEDLEEETLDNLAGAELSELVRDAHLEQRIAAAPDGVPEETGTEFSEAEADFDEEEDEEEGQPAVAAAAPAPREGRSDEGRRGSRGPRRRGRPNGPGGGSRRANAQLSDLPIISELLKQGQEILVQIAKEPIAKKGARITSHIALPGRFLVFMPTVNHVGVSRKISSDEERQRLKRILISEKGSAAGGFIVRTAADGASEDDLRADIRFLISLWNDIKQRADEGKAPALIYHDLNLIERVLRDQVSANFSTIWVDNEAEYERILRFLQRFEPSLVRRVKLYTKETPLFEQFGIQDEISKALKSKVWLKSGGSIVINQTEALVAIDINTGKYVGKTARLEDTILKTNLDAIPEIVRQIRLRDLGGIIVIDFIDMDERKNRHKVMAALEEELKSDRAPSKVLQFNDFGLVAITRKRVKQSLERTLSVQCEVCAGTGMVKSPTTVCNEIYTELRKMQRHLERNDVLLRVHPEVVKTLKAGNARWLSELEEMAGKTIIVKSDPALHPEQFDIQ